MWQTILGILLAAILAALLIRHLMQGGGAAQGGAAAAVREGAARCWKMRRRRQARRRAASCSPALYKGHDVRVTALADTLAVRKLPGLWLMVTLPGALPVSATLDLMMRPAGATTFSNFDLLPFTARNAAGISRASRGRGAMQPEHAAAIRSRGTPHRTACRAARQGTADHALRAFAL